MLSKDNEADNEFTSLINDPDTQPGESYPHGARLLLIAFSVGLLVIMSGIEVTIVAAIGPAIATDLRNSPAYSAYLGTAFLLAAMVAAPLCSSLSDIFGRAIVTLCSGLVLTIGLIACTLAPSMPVLLFARAISGLGGGGISVMSSIILSETVPLRSRAFWYAVGKILSGASMSIGGPVGGLIADRVSWRLAFGAQAPLCLLAASISFACMQKHRDFIKQSANPTTSSTVDITGSLLLALTVIASLISAHLFPSLTREPRLWILWALIVVVALSSGFLLHRVETRVKKPIIMFSLLQDRETISLYVLNFTAAFVYHALLYSVPLFLVIVDGCTLIEAGLYILPATIAASVASLLIGLLVARRRRYRLFLVIAVFMVVLGPLLYSFTIFFAPTSFYRILEVLCILPSSLGFQIVNSISLVALLASKDKANLAAYTSLASLSKSLGGVFGSASTAFLVQFYLSTSTESDLLVNNILRGSGNQLYTIPEISHELLKDSFGYTFMTLALLCFLPSLSILVIKDFELPQN